MFLQNKGNKGLDWTPPLLQISCNTTTNTVIVIWQDIRYLVLGEGVVDCKVIHRKMVRRNKHLNFTCSAKQETEGTDSSLPTLKTEFTSAIHFLSTGGKTHRAYVIKWDWVHKKICQFITLSPLSLSETRVPLSTWTAWSCCCLEQEPTATAAPTGVGNPGGRYVIIYFFVKTTDGADAHEAKLKTVLLPHRVNAKRSRHTIHYLSQRFRYMTRHVNIGITLLLGGLCAY